MPVIVSQSDLGKGDLRLIITNDLGYKTDPFYVKWTIFDINDNRISGNKLPAIKSGVGNYYAPWFACAKKGCHKIIWEYKLFPTCEPTYLQQDFYIQSADNFSCSCSPCTDSSNTSKCSAFPIGTQLGRGDLSIYLKDGDGIPLSAHAVTWQIYNSNGCQITALKDAVQVVTGEYFADFFVNVGAGEYYIQWKVLETSDSPAEVFTYNFTVLCSSINVCIYAPQEIFYCCGSAANQIPYCFSTTLPQDNSSMLQCCDFEIPRVIHLSEQNLPVGGAFTNQPKYLIPSKIRLITFYIRYRRNGTGGFASLKLLWGNGVEEAQSTLINGDFINNSQNSLQNMYMNVYNGPVPLTDDFITFSIETVVPGGSKTARLLASESGLPMQPGIIEITLTAST